jgi:hypothetical protein
VGYLAMRRIADLHPGKAETEARDAAIIAEAARTMPHTLPSTAPDDETLAEAGVLCGFDDALAGQINRHVQPDPGTAHLGPSGTGTGTGPRTLTTPPWPTCSPAIRHRPR